jgi:hypothetical protein
LRIIRKSPHAMSEAVHMNRVIIKSTKGNFTCELIFIDFMCIFGMNQMAITLWKTCTEPYRMAVNCVTTRQHQSTLMITMVCCPRQAETSGSRHTLVYLRATVN